MVLTEFLYVLGDQNIHMTHFIEVFALLQWSGTKPANLKVCLYVALNN